MFNDINVIVCHTRWSMETNNERFRHVSENRDLLARLYSATSVFSAKVENGNIINYVSQVHVCTY